VSDIPQPTFGSESGPIHGQHGRGEAIGSILNGSRKPRWDTRRATGALILFSLGTFTGSIALGAASIPFGLLAVVLLAPATALVAIEYRDRRRLAMAENSTWDDDLDEEPDELHHAGRHE